MDIQQADFLFHLPEYRLVICKQCRYAVQPSAISSHLKNRHQIYRQHRQQILEAVLVFDLADPADIVLPQSDHAPIPHLPIGPGFACSHETCGYMSITLKRMRMHWSQAHGRAASDEIDWRRVHLQTFFRGVHLRYFEVTLPAPDAATALHAAPLHTVTSSPTGDKTAQNGDPNALQPDGTSQEICRPINAESFNIEDLRLWHHFISSTALTLCHDSQFAQYLAEVIPQIPDECLCLVRMVLALTSMHLAYVNPREKEKYIFMAENHHDLALSCFDEVRMNACSNDVQMISAFYKLLTIQQFASVSLVGLRGVDTQASHTLAKVLIAIRSGYSWVSLNPTHETGLSTSALDYRNCDLPYIDERQCEFTKKLAFPAGFPDTNAEQDGICYHAFRELQRAVMLVDTPAKRLYAFVLWPSRVSDSYLLLLSLQHPTSLLIFGHFCTIIKLLDQYWYMAGHANWLLGLIRRLLDAEYHGMLPSIAD